MNRNVITFVNDVRLPRCQVEWVGNEFELVLISETQLEPTCGPTCTPKLGMSPQSERDQEGQ